MDYDDTSKTVYEDKPDWFPKYSWNIFALQAFNKLKHKKKYCPF